MRVPPYHKEPSWQLFFSGVVLGAVIGWVVFLVLYGAIQERQVGELIKAKKQLELSEARYHILIEDNEKLKEEKDKLKVQDIKIIIINHDKYMLGSLTRFSVIEGIKKDLNHLIAKEVKGIKDNKELLKKTIENKSYELDEKKYYFHVEDLYIDTTIEIGLMIVKVE
ncbi:sporulation membrane protein YtrI [Sutcliffiella halmapala]